MKNANNILHGRYVVKAGQNIIKGSVHCSSPECDGVPGAGLQSHLSTPGGVHPATGAGGVVDWLGHLPPITVDVGDVILPAVHNGTHAVADPPGSRHRHSEDPWSVTNIDIQIMTLFM